MVEMSSRRPEEARKGRRTKIEGVVECKGSSRGARELG